MTARPAEEERQGQRAVEVRENDQSGRPRDRVRQDGVDRPDREKGIQGEQRPCGAVDGRAQPGEGTAGGRQGIDRPERRDTGDRKSGVGLVEEPAGGLRCAHEERQERQPRPRPAEADQARPDEGGAEVGDGHEIRRRAQDGRCRGRGDEPERGHGLGVATERDRGRSDGQDEVPDQGRLDRDEGVQATRREQRERPRPDADTGEDHGRRPIASFEQPGTREECRGARDEADQDPRLGTDPAPTEGEAQEEHRAEDEGDPADPREEAARELLLEVGERSGRQRGTLRRRRGRLPREGRAATGRGGPGPTRGRPTTGFGAAGRAGGGPHP